MPALSPDAFLGRTDTLTRLHPRHPRHPRPARGATVETPPPPPPPRWCGGSAAGSRRTSVPDPAAAVLDALLDAPAHVRREVVVKLRAGRPDGSRDPPPTPSPRRLPERTIASRRKGLSDRFSIGHPSHRLATLGADAAVVGRTGRNPPRDAEKQELA